MFNLNFKKNGSSFRYPLNKEKISIGRDHSCDVILPGENISRLHCEIYLRKKRIFFENFSQNRTSLNGEKKNEGEIKENDLIAIQDWIVSVENSESELETTISKPIEKTKVLNGKNNETESGEYYLDTRIIPNKQKCFKRRFQSFPVRIGSGRDNDLVLDDRYVSKRHCKIDLSKDDLIISDLGSTNGIFYEGEKISHLKISTPDTIQIGKTIVKLKVNRDNKDNEDDVLGEMRGRSSSMKDLFATIKRIAPTDATVTITGESGTGKELVARSVHKFSLRARGPFVAINCGAIPPNMIESELFGHEKGAFTGAATLRKGVFEQANGGTLFLDEIAEMPYDMQTRLLRVLETKSIRRIGGERDIPVNVRIIAATNQNLKEKMNLKEFRSDLFFRLYIIPIHIIPLRDRMCDIPALAEHYLNIFISDERPKKLGSKAVKKLMSHQWKGNVRELKNAVQRAVIMSRGKTIIPSDILLTDFKDTGDLHSMPLTGQEREAIIESLRRSDGNQSKAADHLGISRTTLAKKIKKYDIDLSVVRKSI